MNHAIRAARVASRMKRRRFEPKWRFPIDCCAGERRHGGGLLRAPLQRASQRSAVPGSSLGQFQAALPRNHRASWSAVQAT